MAGVITIVKVNVQFEQVLARRFSILGVPALHLYRGGRLIKSMTGAIPKMQLVEWIRSGL